MTINEIVQVVEKYYGYKCQAQQLDGYIDFNYLIIREDGVKFILKITQDTDWFEFNTSQNSLINKLNDLDKHQGNYPELIKTMNNTDMELHTNESGKPVQVRLISFIEGEVMAKVEITKGLCYDLGKFLGRTDIHLQQIEEPVIAVRRFDWDIKFFHDNENFIQYITDPYKNLIVRYYLSQFESIVQPELRKLRTSLIHGDGNEWNVFVKENKVSGLIDFGDMVYSTTVNELAIGITYAAMLVDKPLEYAAEMVKGYHSVLPLTEKEIELLYYLIATRLCISVCHSAFNRKENPDNEYMTISEKPVWNLLMQWIEINPRKAENLFRKACNLPEKPMTDLDQFVEQRHQFISKTFSISYDEPIKMLNAALQYMYDDRGNTWLDCVNNIPHVGYSHPTVVRAAQKQMAVLNTNSRYLYDQLNEYAEQLCAKFPEPLNKVYLVNSGSAATDLALRLARHYTNRKDIIVIDSAYHGNITTAIEVSPYKYEKKGGVGKASFIHKANVPDTFKGKYRRDDPHAAHKYAMDVKQILDASVEKGQTIAAYLAEPIPGCSGQVVLPDGYFKEVYKYVREAGAVCIADEVQIGFGRVGSHFWAFETQDVVPDIVIIGKPIGNGHPMAAVVTTPEIAEAFEQGPEYFNSFGGNPVSCVIGKAVLDVIEEEKLQQNALEIGNYLISELNKLKEKYPIIGDVRGMGLFLGVELIRNSDVNSPATEDASFIVQRMKDEYILMSTEGPDNNVLKIKPPLVFTKANADRLIKELDIILDDMR